MKVHEYQAKELFATYNIPVPQGRLATTPQEAEKAAGELMETTGTNIVVVKAQIHAGGRGKGGGVKITKSPEEAKAAAAGMLGQPLITHQTGPDGTVVKKVYIEQGLGIATELYLGMVLDREKERLTMMASTEGGMEIEKVAAETPEKILKEAIDPLTGLTGFQARNLAFGLGLKGPQVRSGVSFMMGLYKLFVAHDCSLAEINPLVVTTDDQVVALDAKLNFDDSGLFRHKQLEELRDLTEEEPLETEARKVDLNYIKLDGNIGCMVNGAGLAMATMDIIKLAGGEPANFLDVGGGVSTEQVEMAFKIILKDPAVKAIFVNIFGGIVRCDVIAQGIVDAAKAVELDRPLVVRLEGTNVEQGRKIIADSGLTIIPAKDMAEGARLAVEAASAAMGGA